jgi:hypothetical protein
VGASEAQGFATKPLAPPRSFGELTSNEMLTTAKTAQAKYTDASGMRMRIVLEINSKRIVGSAV